MENGVLAARVSLVALAAMPEYGIVLVTVTATANIRKGVIRPCPLSHDGACFVETPIAF